MKLFIDTSVILAAAGSEKGASRYVFEHATVHGWSLLSIRYCLEEAQRNALKVGRKVPATLDESMVPKLALVPMELAFDKALVFSRSKDRPVLISALGAYADHLLTLDEGDFQEIVPSGGELIDGWRPHGESNRRLPNNRKASLSVS